MQWHHTGEIEQKQKAWNVTKELGLNKKYFAFILFWDDRMPISEFQYRFNQYTQVSGWAQKIALPLHFHPQSHPSLHPYPQAGSYLVGVKEEANIHLRATT